MTKFKMNLQVIFDFMILTLFSLIRLTKYVLIPVIIEAMTMII